MLPVTPQYADLADMNISCDQITDYRLPPTHNLISAVSRHKLQSNDAHIDKGVSFYTFH